MNPSSTFKPSLRSQKISAISVLVVDPDLRLTSLMRKVLSSLGFGAIYTARDGSQAMNILLEKPIDLAITDWDMTPMDGLGFVQSVRREFNSPNKRLPMLMLTGKAKRRHVETARDAGITEFLVKPFTVRTLCDRIILMIDHPRNFILSAEYSGPDRRRRSESPASGYDRRREGPLESKVIARHENVVVLRKGEEDVAIVQPDFALKEKIGMDISLDDIFSAENVAQAQRILHRSRNDFLTWVVSDLDEVEQALLRIQRAPDHGVATVDALASAVLHVKSRAGIFDYELASAVAESLYDLCLDTDHFGIRRVQAARKHLDALYVIFQRNIQGDGGVMGEELLKSLVALSNIVE